MALRLATRLATTVVSRASENRYPPWESSSRYSKSNRPLVQAAESAAERTGSGS